MENWIFFSANLLFTAFNAWLAWQAWARQRAADFPAANTSIRVADDPHVVEIEVILHNQTSVTWHFRRADLIRPRSPALYYPLALMVQNQASGEPWNPAPVNLAKATGAKSVKLFGLANPGGTGREVLWIGATERDDLQLEIKLAIESSDPQPRRHTIHVKRQMPALRPVKTT